MKTLPEVKKLVGALPETKLPLALLPVQVQTRFVTRDGKALLLVRLYPDELHLDGHEPGLTAAEVEWGRRAWRLAWPMNKDPEGERLAWTQLSERFGRRRAEWIARKLRPTNLKQRPGTPPVFPKPGPLRDPDAPAPVLARRLPDRWVVMGYQGGQRVLLEAGAPIAKQLVVGPSFDDSVLPDPGPEKLPLEPAMRWLVDFGAAEKVGMGIRIELPPTLQGTTLDTLLVFGLKTSLAAGPSAKELEALLDAQRYTRGLEFLAPGTPTNNTSGASSGFSRIDRDASGAFEAAPASAKKTSDGALAARLLGIKGAVVAGLENAASTDDLDARQLQTALWPATGGYYLDQIMAPPDGQPPAFTQAQLDQARGYFVDFVRQLGPLPGVRAGRQPYGVLPAMSLELLAGSPAGRGRFVQSLRFLQGAWRAALSQAPRLAAGNPESLVEILRLQPASVGYRARLAMETLFFAPTPVFSSSLSDHLLNHGQLLHARLQAATASGLASQERFFDIIPADSAVNVRSELVAPGGEVAGATLSPNYITFLRTASFDDILAERFPAGFPQEGIDTLLYLLLRHSVLLAYATTARRILIRKGRLPNERYREPVLVDILGEQKPARTPTLLRAATADDALRGRLHTLTAAQEPEAAVLEELRASLEYLETRPVDALARHLRGCVDVFAYRLDAWVTSLATRRLTELRKATPRGVTLGAFGWVQNLEASPRTQVAAVPAGEEGPPLFAARELGGFLHAPSLGQASAAAVLRSGYLAHAGEANAGALAINLSSDRVRLAETLIDGMRQGQQLGALLGYRFERALHERQLDRFIAGFRRASRLGGVYFFEELLQAEFPDGPPVGVPEQIARYRALQGSLTRALDAVRGREQLPPTATVGEIESIVAAKVVDGMGLVRLRQGTGILFDRLGAPVGSDRPALDAELDALDRALDALSDALTAEGVYQLVRGNPARAAASVDAVAHGEIQPPDLRFTETPRPGTPLTHRLAVLFSGAGPAAPAGIRAARRAAEPNIDAWLKQLVGDVKNVRLGASFVAESGEVLVATDNVRLTPLGLSNTDALYLSASSETGQPSDLERLLEHALRREAPAKVTADARFQVDYSRMTGTLPTELSLGEFLELNAAFRATILSARAIDARDFVQATSETPTGVDAAELALRADRALTAVRQARDALAAQLAAAKADPGDAALDALRDRLVDQVFLGIPEAVPVSARGVEARENVLAQASSVESEASRRIERATGVDDPVERLEVLFGRGFRVLPLVRPANAKEIGTALGDSDTLLGGDALQALSWLQGVSRVRPGASRLAAALGYAAVLERKAALDLKVAQLPFVAGERWVALPPATDEGFPPGKLSLVVHLPRAFKPAEALAGLVVDEWVETVPAAEVTTGVAFNFDAPGARPPQAVVLAVAPPGPARWELETLEKTLLETLELAQLRALDPQALGGDELLRRALPALYVSANLAGEALSTDFSKAVH